MQIQQNGLEDKDDINSKFTNHPEYFAVTFTVIDIDEINIKQKYTLGVERGRSSENIF